MIIELMIFTKGVDVDVTACDTSLHVSRSDRAQQRC